MTSSPLFLDCDLLISSTPLEGPEQMAFDDLLLQRVTRPLLRFYCWQRPCITFGYFQQWRTVSEIFPNQQLVRRSTGGGCVVHGNDLTFSLVLPGRIFPPLCFYKIIHEIIAEAFKTIAIPVHLVTKKEVLQNACCFEAPALYDLLWKGKKILGGAQRRHHGHLLYQGSISNFVAGEISNIPNFFRTIALSLSQEVNLIKEKPDWLEEVSVLARKQYRSESWIKRR